MSDGTFYHPGVCPPNNRSIVVAILDLSILTYLIITLANYPPTNPAHIVASRAERSERTLSREGSTINLLYLTLTDCHGENLEKAGFTSCAPSVGAWQHLCVAASLYPTPNPFPGGRIGPACRNHPRCMHLAPLYWLGWAGHFLRVRQFYSSDRGVGDGCGLLSEFLGLQALSFSRPWCGETPIPHTTDSSVLLLCIASLTRLLMTLLFL